MTILKTGTKPPAVSGFTLTEVMLCVVFLSLGAGVLAGAYSTILRVQRGVDGVMNSVALLEEKLFEARIEEREDSGLSPCFSSGKFDEPHGCYMWEKDVVPSGAPHFCELKITVSDICARNPRRTGAVTYVFKREE